MSVDCFLFGLYWKILCIEPVKYIFIFLNFTLWLNALWIVILVNPSDRKNIVEDGVCSEPYSMLG